jgi:hypothetical protein
MVSRLIAARPAILARSTAALEEIAREFSGATLREVAYALSQSHDAASEPEWSAAFNRHDFEKLLWRERSAPLRAAIAAQHDLFRRHLHNRSAGAERIILCDTGLYGSTVKLLSVGMPEIKWSCVMFARSNYKGFDAGHFAYTSGLSVEQDSYSILNVRSSVFRFWHLIEQVLEPRLQSVQSFELSARSGQISSNLEREGWRRALVPAENEVFSGVLSYFARLTPLNFTKCIYDDSDEAWRGLRRLIARPHASEVLCLSPEPRSRDFGRSEKVATIASARSAWSLKGVRASLWKEGKVAQSFPTLRYPLQIGIEVAYLARSISAAVGRSICVLSNGVHSLLSRRTNEDPSSC